MAYVDRFVAFTTVADSTRAPGAKGNRQSTVSIRVSAADGRAYVAAANEAARIATDVGVLLAATEALFLGGAGAIVQHGVQAEFVNDAYAPLDPATNVLNSNKINVSYSSIVAGITRNFSLSVPQRDPADYTLASNGTTIQQGLADAIDDFVAALSNTGLSLYGGAISPVMELEINDQ